MNMEVMAEVASFEELTRKYDKDRIVRVWNAYARNREYRKEHNKSYRTQVRDDAKQLRALTEAAKAKGVKLTDLLKSL